MDKRELYDGLAKLEEDLKNSFGQLSDMKAALQEIVEKNTTLELENQKLREYLQ
ncbi:initiation control protein YabA, partial [Enterococcus sp. 2201sp1_2201st1_B8_2201SCRN_220225]